MTCDMKKIIRCNITAFLYVSLFPYGTGTEHRHANSYLYLIPTYIK